MNRELPNYFLADLPSDYPVSGQIIREACLTLKRNRETHLRSKSTSMMIRLLAELGERWLDPEDEFRRLALEQGPGQTGFSREILQAGLDGFFSQLTAENLQSLVIQDLGSLQRLDLFSQSSQEIQERRASWCQGPELLVHIAAGNLPNPTFMSIVLGLLVRSAQFVKCARGAAFLPCLFAHSIYDAEPKIASCLEIAQWEGGTPDLDRCLFEEAACLTATGTDETLSEIRRRLPQSTRFLGYGHRISWSYVSADALSGRAGKRMITHAAEDVIAWDQNGCLSPHGFYVQVRGAITPETFAELLAEELARLEAQAPRGILCVEDAATISARRGFYEIRAAHSNETKMWCSPQSTAWTVVYENDPLFQFSCMKRFVHVKATQGLEETLRHAERVRGQVSTVGLAAPLEQLPALALRLAQWGVSRICPFGKMQSPPLTWRHDGRPALGDLVQWTDWEQ